MSDGELKMLPAPDHGSQPASDQDAGDAPRWCPCCGAWASLVEDAQGGWRVRCSNSACGLESRGFGFGRQGRALALAAWNRRADGPKSPCLARCPSCGAMPAFRHEGGRLQAGCGECGLSAPFIDVGGDAGSYDDMMKAATEWNGLARLIEKDRID